jgi:hypothetical protein
MLKEGIVPLRNKVRIYPSVNWGQIGFPISILVIPSRKIANFKGTKKVRLVAVWIQFSFFCFHLNLDFPKLKGKWVSVRKEGK